MKPSDEFFPKDIVPHVDEIASMELRRREQEIKVLSFYDALSRDPLTTTLKHSEITRGPLLSRLIHKLSSMVTMRGSNNLYGVRPDSIGSITSVSGIYDSYPYPEVPDVEIKSSIMKVSSNCAQTNFVALLLTARSKEVDDNVPLSANEVNSSIPVILIPGSNDGSFAAYAAGEQAGHFDIVSPAQAEYILDIDIQRYVNSVNSRSKQ